MNPIAKIIQFNKRYRLFSHIAFWITIFLISTSQDSYQNHEDWLTLNTLFYYALILITQIGTAYFLAYFIIPQLLNTNNYLTVFFYFVLGMYFLCALARIINIYIREPMASIAPKDYETLFEILTNFTKLLYVYFLRNLSIAIVFIFIKLLMDHYEIQNKSLSFQKQKAETELKLLKTQLNPHFLFNTLNNIYSLALSASSETPIAIARLSDILDYILYRCNARLVPLSDEINLINNYIELEKLRYDDHLKISFKTSIDHNIEIAPLILLSIVENAFKHGAAKDQNSPSIEINLTVTPTTFLCTITNTFLPHLPTSQISYSTSQIGLPNIQHQLELIYHNAHQLSIEQKEGQFIVTLFIELNPHSK